LKLNYDYMFHKSILVKLKFSLSFIFIKFHCCQIKYMYIRFIKYMALSH